MNKTLQALFVFLVTVIVSYFVAGIFFSLIIDVFIVPLVGFRPVLAAINTVFFLVLGYKLVDSKYHFEEKGGRLFKDYKLFKK